jgi:hypothetical protein
MIEKRKNSRFILEHDTYAALGNEYNRVGKVIDISFGGLSFEYILSKKIENNVTKLDIFSFGNIFHLYNFSCKIVYNIDVNIPYVNNSFGKIFTTKRSGLKFNKLSDDDFLQLKLFIESYSDFYSIAY